MQFLRLIRYDDFHACAHLKHEIPYPGRWKQNAGLGQEGYTEYCQRMPKEAELLLVEIKPEKTRWQQEYQATAAG